MANPTFVQGTAVNWSTSTSSKPLAYPSAQTAGNCNVVYVQLATGIFVSRMTDTLGNKYARLIDPIVNAGLGAYVDVWVAANIAAGPNTVTITLSAASSFGDLKIQEWTGADLFNPADVVFSGTGSSASPSSGAGTPVIGGTVICFCAVSGANTNASMTAGSGYTKFVDGDTFGTAIEVGNSPAVAGTPVTATWTVTSGNWTALAFVLRPPTTVTIPQVNQVLLNGTQLGTLGANTSQLPNLLDANPISYTAAPDSNAGYWAGMDAGVAVSGNFRVRISCIGGDEDRMLGGQIQVSNDPTFATGTVTLLTVGSRPITGTLLNEYLVPSNGTAYRYFRYLFQRFSVGQLGDLDFIVQATTGVAGRPINPVIMPPSGDFDQPIVITMSCITSSALLYYTTDGSTPTSSSNLYAGPISLSSTATFKAIAIDSTYGSSRVTTTIFHVPSAVVSTDQVYDNRGYPVWAIDGSILQDPNSGWWYKFGTNYDQPGVITAGFLGVNIYRSADLKNWIYVGVIPATAPSGGLAIGLNSVNGYGRTCVLYNALNNNYVMWSHYATYASNIGMAVFSSSNPETGWVLRNTFTTIGSFDGNGDCSLFLDPADGVTAYFVHMANSNADLVFDKLSTDYLSAAGVQTSYVTSTVFGGTIEAPQVFKNGTTYFLMYSQATQWQPNLNSYATSSAPVGPWTLGGNPFQTSADPNSLGLAGTQYGVSQANANTIAYDSQTQFVIQIPGRGSCFIWTGDRYDNGLVNPAFSSATATVNFEAYRRLRLPIVFPTGTTMTITWSSSWSIDTTYPTVSGAPSAATGLSATGRTFSWTNNTGSNPIGIYLDYSTSSSFTSVLRSEVISIGTNSPVSSYSPIVIPNTGYYRIRTVNASGTSNSSSLQFTQPALTSGGNTPIMTYFPLSGC